MAELAAKTGFPGVEVGILKAMESTPQETLALCKKFGVKPTAIGLPVEIRKDEETFEKDMQQLPKAAAFAAAIGVPRMVTWILSSSALPKEEQKKILKTRLQKILRVFEPHGVSLGLEFLGPLHIRKAQPYEFIWRMPEMLEFAMECGKNCGLLLDSWHWHHAGATPEDIVAAGRERIVHVHLADAQNLPPEQIRDNERLLPGEGIVNWDGFFGSLKKIGYSYALSPEVFGRGLKDMPVEEAAFLTSRTTRKLLAKYGL
jgi:sugar phosphate isomerase/epimerase